MDVQIKKNQVLSAGNYLNGMQPVRIFPNLQKI